MTLAGARALTTGRAESPPFLDEPLVSQRSPVVQLDDLVRFVQHPVRAFLRGRLGLSLGDYSTDVDDALPVDLDGLEEWDIGQRLLDARLDGCDFRAAYRAEIARGHLPPGLLGKPVIEKLQPTVEGLVEATEAEAGAGAGGDGRRPRRARRRPHADRHGRGRARRRGDRDDVLAPGAASTAWRRGCACSRSPPRRLRRSTAGSRSVARGREPGSPSRPSRR